MLQPAYIVHFIAVAVDQVRNFAEELHRALRDAGIGEVPNEAAAIDEVHVEVTASTNLGEALKHIRHLLGRHMLVDSASVTRTIPESRSR